MTLIAALQGQDGLVLACDSRASVGDPRGLRQSGMFIKRYSNSAPDADLPSRELLN
jgi:hypothetical protein